MNILEYLDKLPNTPWGVLSLGLVASATVALAYIQLLMQRTYRGNVKEYQVATQLKNEFAKTLTGKELGITKCSACEQIDPTVVSEMHPPQKPKIATFLTLLLFLTMSARFSYKALQDSDTMAKCSDCPATCSCPNSKCECPATSLASSVPWLGNPVQVFEHPEG